jgi:peptide-methionine (S)-S-oxide reductase
METIVLAGGCFWCIEALFKQLKGIESAVSGYTGGTTENPTYDQMHYENTGHAEAVQITYDPKVISYQELLEIFYAVHDPTTLNRQGNDVGEQYRSAIFYQNDEQKKIAEDVTKNFAAKHWSEPIVTEIVPLKKFWPAEDYHQNYFERNPEQAYCQVVINPKLAKFREKFASRLK